MGEVGMNIVTLVVASLAGGIGASLRWIIDVTISRRTRSRFPWGVWVVNVSGSFLLGVLSPLIGSTPLGVALGAGLLGGYTTFSTVTVASVTLAHSGARRLAAMNIVVTFVACVLASLGGVACGTWIAGL